MLQLLPIAVLTVSAVWLRFSMSRLWALGIFGLAFVKCSVEMIVSTFSGRPFPLFFASHGPLLCLALLVKLQMVTEAQISLALWYVFGCVAVGLFYFCVAVTNDISAHLGIRVFKIAKTE
jgi:hypothetical protein